MNKFKYLLLILSFILSFNSFQTAVAADKKSKSSYEEEYDDEVPYKESDEEEDY